MWLTFTTLFYIVKEHSEKKSYGKRRKSTEGVTLSGIHWNENRRWIATLEKSDTRVPKGQYTQV